MIKVKSFAMHYSTVALCFSACADKNHDQSLGCHIVTYSYFDHFDTAQGSTDQWKGTKCKMIILLVINS